MGADRQEIIEALGGAPATAANARVMLRELFCGETRLKPLPKGRLRGGSESTARDAFRAAGTCGRGARYAQLLLHARRRCAFAESQ